MSKKAKGERGEIHARQYLTEQGYRLLACNYRVEGGEIDIIVSQGEWLVFVEVKYRSDESFSSALEQLTSQQCRRVRHTARIYMLHHDIDEHRQRIRFDVITVCGPGHTLHWFKDAF